MVFFLVLSGEYSGSESESFDDTNNGRRSAIRQEPQGQETHKDFTISSPSNYDTLIIHNDDGPRFSSSIPKYRYGNRGEISNQEQLNGGRQNVDIGVREITNIPDDYLSQSHVRYDFYIFIKMIFNHVFMFLGLKASCQRSKSGSIET